MSEAKTLKNTEISPGTLSNSHFLTYLNRDKFTLIILEGVIFFRHILSTYFCFQQPFKYPKFTDDLELNRVFDPRLWFSILRPL